MGPAGSINSCVNDMLKWIQFQLNKGKIGDKQLVSESEMQSMQTPYIFISFPMESNERSHSKRMSLILKGSPVIVQNFQWKMAWLLK